MFKSRAGRPADNLRPLLELKLKLKLAIPAKPSAAAGSRIETANSNRGEKLRRPPRVCDVVGYRHDHPECTEETIQAGRDAGHPCTALVASEAELVCTPVMRLSSVLSPSHTFF